jgi:hypothetical protein
MSSGWRNAAAAVLELIRPWLIRILLFLRERFERLGVLSLLPFPDPIGDTLSAVVAFVVPGGDPYSVSQGQTSATLGGIDAGAVPALRRALDNAYQPPKPIPPAPGSVVVAEVLNATAVALFPSTKALLTPFTGLSFAQKAAVFAYFDTAPLTANTSLRLLSTLLPTLAAHLSYGEVGVYDNITRTVTAMPVGWQLAGYEGVADGRADIVGYFEARTSVKTDPRY